MSSAAPSDARVALMALRAEWPGTDVPELARTPPVVLVAQLYALVADRRGVDAEVEAMKAEGVLRVFQLAGGGTGGGGEFGVVLTDDLRAVVDGDRVVDRFFETLVGGWTDVTVSGHELREGMGMGDGVDVGTALVRKGLLTLKGERDFWFSVPRAGPFLRMRRKGNTELMGILKRAPYKEMHLSKLELRRLRSSPFPALFHIRDVIGSGAAESVATSLGILVRVTRTDGRTPDIY